MGQPWNALALLMLYAAATVCLVVQRNIPDENFTEPAERCHWPPPGCFDSVRKYDFDTIDGTRSVIADRQALTQLAADIGAMTSCLEAGAASFPCRRFRLSETEMALYGFMTLYLRSQDGIDHLVALSGSRCLQSYFYDKVSQLYAVYLQCVAELRGALTHPGIQPSDNQCVDHSQLQHCLANGVNVLCGQAASDFVNNVMGFAAITDSGRQSLQFMFPSLNLCLDVGGSPVTRRFVEDAWSLLNKMRT